VVEKPKSNTDFADLRVTEPEFEAMEIKITIDHADFGRADLEFGISENDLKLFDQDGSISVKVFVDGQPAELVKASARSIIAKAPLILDEKILTVVVTTRRESILNELAYDVREKQFRKSRDDSENDESTLKDIAAAIKKIAEAMPPVRTR
jgi:cyanophycinase-like exopeptidase